MTSFAIGADDGSVDILALADAMEEEVLVTTILCSHDNPTKLHLSTEILV